MVFNSFEFLVFLPLVYIIFLLTTQRYRWATLLASSVAFYSTMRRPELLLALTFVTVVSYFTGLRLTVFKKPKQQTRLLVAGICLNIIPLLVLKYLPDLLDTVFQEFGSSQRVSNSSFFGSLAAIGVSYYVFQAISYLIDIYMEDIEPEKHFGIFALSLCFFPKVMQGPLERSGHLIPQLHKNFQFDYQNTRDGLLQIGWGLFKKLVLADRLTFFVNAVYNNPQNYTGLPLILATYLFAFHIYFDFSAYTDIALGTAKLFGINLTQNFNLPYLASSISDFWRRWHISFSRWILDYIFKPLQFEWRDLKVWGTIGALIITFFASGIWHGASWNFMIWGLLHGIFLSLEILFSPLEKKLLKRFRFINNRVFKALRVLLTFNLVCFTWIFFRSKTITDSFYVVSHLFVGWEKYVSFLWQFLVSMKTNYELIMPVMLEQGKSEWAILLAMLAIYGAFVVIQNHTKGRFLSTNRSVFFRWAVYYFIVIITLLFGVYEQSQYIYFQF